MMPLRIKFRAYVLLSLILMACSGSRPVPIDHSPPPQDALLVIRDTSDGGQAVAWQAASESDRARIDQAVVQGRESGPVVLTARRARDCDKEQIECFRRCWKRKPPYPSERGDPGHYQHCQETCLEAYQDCLARNKLQALEFTAMHEAIDWLKRHRQELLVGTIVTAAGVTFIVISVGAGVVVLAPLVLMTQSGSTLEPATCEG